MQLTLEVRRIVGAFTKNAGSMQMENIKLSFKEPKKLHVARTEKEIRRLTLNAKRVWNARLGIGRKNKEAQGKRKIQLPPGHKHSAIVEEINRKRESESLSPREES